MNARIRKCLKLGTISASALIGLGASYSAMGQTCIGSCGSLGANGSVTLSPSGDTSYQWISTAGGVDGAGELPGKYNGTDGSSFTTADFTVTKGEALTFYFNYVTSDGTASFPDYAFAQLQSSGGTPVAILFTATTTPTGNTSPGAGLPPNQATLSPSATAIIPGAPVWAPLGGYSGHCFMGPTQGCGYTGWIKSTYDVPTAGSYQVQFGVSNANDTLFDSGLAFDQVSVGGVPIPTSAVPEPGTYAMMLAGLGLLITVARRRGGFTL